MKRSYRFPFLLGAALFWVPCADAQTRTTPKNTSPTTTQNSAKSNRKSSEKTSLPLLFGVGTGALISGIALGFALKKTGKSAIEPGAGADSFHDVPFPLAFADENEKITRRNVAFERFFGPGQSLAPLFHPDDLERARTQIREVSSGEKAEFLLECRFFGASGALLYARLGGQKPVGARRGEILLAFNDATAQMHAEVELLGARDAISALYGVIAGDKSRDLDSKIKSLLAMGCGRFELSTGVLGRFADDHFETLWVQSVDKRVRPALTLERLDNSNSGTSRGDSSGVAALLGLEMLPTSSNWRNFPHLTKNEGTAYFGAPVLVKNELFGMLSFSSLETRDAPFNNGEIELLQLMADWVGGEIERENTRIALEKQQKTLLEVNEKLEKLATHDPLTGLKNRRAFAEKLDEEWSRARRYGTPLSIVMLDVDKFKLYNDSFGHPAGDEVLRRVARVLGGAVRVTDFLARYGGEEFVLILPNTDADGAMILAQRLRAQIENATWKERPVTASLGVSTLAPIHKAAADLLQAADGALYQSKERGRNRVTHTRDGETGDGETEDGETEVEETGNEETDPLSSGEPAPQNGS